MKKIIIVFIISIFFLNFTPLLAHPGKTDGDGCHTCRTNCEKWGLEYGEYHCHNGDNSNVNSYPAPSPQNSNNYSSNSNYGDQKSSGSEKISETDFNAKKYGVVFDTKAHFFMAILIYTCVVIFVMMIFFSRRMTVFEKDCIKELMSEKQKLQEEYNNKVQNQKQTYNQKIKNLNQVIKESADQKILEYLLSRYKGQENPYNGKIIESTKDIEEYLEMYKSNHKDDFSL